MKISKKLLSFLLTAILILQCFGTVSFAADEKVQVLYEKECSVIEQLGYFSSIEDFKWDDLVSGENLAAVFKKMTDVDISDYYEGIRYVSQVKFAEVLKVLLTDMGYGEVSQLKDGYPLGFVNQAFKIDLVDGIKFEAGDSVTYRTLAKLIYNAMEIRIIENSGVSKEQSFYTESNVLYMEERLGLRLKEGIFAGIFAEKNESDLYVKIDDVKYKIKTEANLAEMVGFYVEAYYSVEDEMILAVSRQEKGEILTVNADDVVSYKDYTLTYYNGKSLRKIEFFGADVYKNGARYPSYTEADFKFPLGSISFVKYGSGEYKTVVIKQYSDFVVSGIVSDKYTLYSETGLEEKDKILVLDPKEEKYVSIYDAKGEKLQYADIVSGDVLSVAQSDNVISIIRCNERITGFKVDMMENNDEDIILYSGEQRIKLADSYLAYTGGVYPQISDELTLYLNSFGQAAYVAVGERSEYKVAYLLRTGYFREGVHPRLEAELLMTNNKFEVYDCAENLLIELHDGTSKKYKQLDKAYDVLAAYSGVASFKFNEDGKITHILMPLDPPDNPDYRVENRLYKYIKENGVAYRYSPSTQSLTYRLFVKLGTTVTFTKPSIADDYDDYYAYTSNILQGETSYSDKMEAFTYGKDTYTIRAMVLANTNLNASFTQNHGFFLVTKIVNSTSEDGEDIKKVYGKSTSGTDVVYSVADGGYALDHMSNVLGNVGNLKAQPGDFIRIIVDKRTGLVNKAQMLYDFSAENPVSGSLGFIPGANAMYNAGASTSNPFTVYRSSGQSLGGSANEPTSSSIDRYFLGWVLEKDGNYLRVTTQDLSKGAYDPALKWDSKNNPTGYLTEIHPHSSYGGMTVTIEGNDVVEVIPGKNINLIRDYRHSGSDCSRVLIKTAGGSPGYCVVLNYE